MTRTRYQIFESSYPYFITCSIVGWLPVFTRPEATNIIYDSWAYLQQESQLQIFSYVILENHLHWIALAPHLSDVIKNFKSFTARQLVALLKRQSNQNLLNQLKQHKLSHKKESVYQVWQEGSYPQQIQNLAMMQEKKA